MPATRDGKTWRCQFYYEDWQGIRHKKNKRGFKTKAEAEEWERNFRQQQRKDLDINFENFVEIYFADVENRLRESTIKNKRYVFANTELLQEKVDDLERVKRYAGAEQIDTIVRKVKEQERTEQQIRREEVEADLRTTEQSLAKLHKLLDNKPIEYVAMALSGEMQAYCDIEDDMVKGMFGTIVQGYLKKGYNRAMAEMMAREFFRYES